MPRVGIVLLAAGASRRLGTPKQTLRYDGKTLLRRALEEACASAADPVLAVLGSDAAAMAPEFAGTRAVPVVHAGWEEGMGSSLRAGMEALQRLAPDRDAVLVLLCDQPFVTAVHLDALRHAFAAGDPRPAVVASAYAGTLGPPCLFARALFGELAALSGDTGARALLRRQQEAGAPFASLPFPEGAFDIDRPEDIDRARRAGPPTRSPR